MVSEKAKALVALGERARNESPVEQVPWTRVGKLDTRTAVSVLVGFLQEDDVSFPMGRPCVDSISFLSRSTSSGIQRADV